MAWGRIRPENRERVNAAMKRAKADLDNIGRITDPSARAGRHALQDVEKIDIHQETQQKAS